MTRFELKNGVSLGARVSSRDGATWFATDEELQVLWGCDESEDVVSDNGWSGSVGELLDMFATLRRLSDDEVERRFGEGRSKSGLGLQLKVSTEGRLFITK